MTVPRRRRSTAGRDLRSDLIDVVRRRIDGHRGRVVFEDGAVSLSPWPRLLAQLEAGEPVVVDAYLLPADVRPGEAWGRVRVDSGGSVKPVAPS